MVGKQFMKICRTILYVQFFLMNPIFAKEGIPHISSKFQIEATWDFPALELADGMGKLVTFLDDSALYFASNTIRLSEDSIYRMRLYKVWLRNGESEAWDVKLPKKSKVDGSFAHHDTYWLQGIAVSGNDALLFMEDYFFIYKKRKGQWRLEKRIPLQDGITGYYEQDSLYVFQETEHEKFTLYRYDTLHYRAEKRLEMPLQSPFVKQFTPNRYLAIESDAFYVLETDQPSYSCYARNGDFRFKVEGKIPNWHSIPFDLRKKIMDFPYGVERIYQALEYNTGNSYCTQLFPFSKGETIMGYHHFDTLSQHQEFRLVTGRRGRGGECEWTPQRFALQDAEMYNEELFPYYFYHSAIVSTDCFNGRLVQILKTAPVDYRGKSDKAYRDSLNAYYKEHSPVWKIRILRWREHLETLFDTLDLYDLDGERVNLKRVNARKLVLCFSNDVQCSGCRRYLYQFLRSALAANGDDMELMVVFRRSSDYLARREMLQQVSQELGETFTPVFVSMGGEGEFRNAFYEPYKYPKVLLMDKSSGEYEFFDSDRLFPADMLQYRLSDEFLESFTQFVRD